MLRVMVIIQHLLIKVSDRIRSCQLRRWKQVIPHKTLGTRLVIPRFSSSNVFSLEGRSTAKNMAAEAGFYDQELTYQGFNQDHFEGQSTKRKKLDDGQRYRSPAQKILIMLHHRKLFTFVVSPRQHVSRTLCEQSASLDE